MNTVILSILIEIYFLFTFIFQLKFLTNDFGKNIFELPDISYFYSFAMTLSAVYFIPVIKYYLWIEIKLFDKKRTWLIKKKIEDEDLIV